LDIVVAVNQYGLGSSNILEAVHHRMAGGLVHGCVIGPGFFEKFYQPLGALVHIRLVFRFGADGRNAKEGKQLVKKALFIFLDISFHLCGRFPQR
jgi:hypothetical protein